MSQVKVHLDNIIIMLLIESAEVVQIPLLNGGFDLENIIKEVDEETALVWLCNPNNQLEPISITMN